MNTNPEMTFGAADALGLFSKYRVLLIVTTLFSVVFCTAAAYILPNKYKAHFVVAVDPKYFQSPLTREFIPEVSDPVELKAEAAALLWQTLTPDFLDALGQKYGLYQPSSSAFKIPAVIGSALSKLKTFAESHGLYQPDKKVHNTGAAQESLLTHIDISNVDGMTFKVEFSYTDPDVTYQAVQDIYTQMVRSVLDVRTSSLVAVRDAIRKRLQLLAFSVSASSSSPSDDPHSISNPEIAREELADVRNQIRSLSAQYTEEHPLLRELRSRERTLSQSVRASSGNRSRSSVQQENPVIGGESQEDVSDMSKDLLRKMNYLNIALESDKGHPSEYIAVLEAPLYPLPPIVPRKILFALAGVLLGLFGSLFVAAVREYFERSTLHAEALARQLSIPLLGQLPPVDWKKWSGH